MTSATKPTRPPANRPEPDQHDDQPFRPTPEQLDDYRWAYSDPDIVKNYAGQMIVPFRKQVIGNGTPVEAAAQARRYLASIGLAAEPIMVIQITDYDNFPIQ